MKIAILKERRENERRVAATPDSVKRLMALGFDIVVETGAGESSSFSDQDYKDVGADIGADASATADDADIVLKVQRPLLAGEGEIDELSLIKSGAYLIAMLAPYTTKEAIDAYAAAGVNAMAMELMPRISRAQGMDVLSSQSNLAGYKAVVDAANHFGRAMPMMMTAAGTIAPARVLVMGAGVAGLQAIATAKRMGAIVSATDVRPVAKEQVESLGGKFVMVESDETEDAETAGGYAKEMSDEYKAKQAELVAATIATQDIAICTALIPGRPAPMLISKAMVESMRPGSIIFDMAAETGGNCELTVPGETIVHNGVTIIGYLNVPSHLAVDASSLYARNLVNFLSPHVDEETKEFAFNMEDETVTGILLTSGGKIVHPQFVGEGE
ncbi:MAG: Re/Si-specific NAD(P)(+) transhydrogenase subunit alpha [Alphaproteobacteria bacterium]|nr:MAG: Re/Si-specific NAD(P)(+) transhydrogenase subunit alpha [Alphaproteobacteria bacterium]